MESMVLVALDQAVNVTIERGDGNENDKKDDGNTMFELLIYIPI